MREVEIRIRVDGIGLKASRLARGRVRRITTEFDRDVVVLAISLLARSLLAGLGGGGFEVVAESVFVEAEVKGLVTKVDLTVDDARELVVGVGKLVADQV